MLVPSNARPFLVMAPVAKALVQFFRQAPVLAFLVLVESQSTDSGFHGPTLVTRKTCSTGIGSKAMVRLVAVYWNP